MTVQIKVEYDVDSSDLKDATGKLDKMSKSTQGAEKGAANLKSSLASVGKAASVASVAIAATVGAMAKFISSSLDAADAIAKGSAKLGLTTTAYQELKFALGQVGISSEQMNIGMRRFTRTIGESAQGSKTAMDAFRSLGGEFENFTGMGGDIEDQFEGALEALAGMEDQNQALAISMKIFGDAGQGFMLAAKAGASGIRELRTEAQELGLILDESTIKKSEALNDKFAALKQTVDASWVQLWADFAVNVLDLGTFMDRLNGAVKELMAGDTLEDQLFDVNNAAIELGETIKELQEDVDGGFLFKGMADAADARLAAAKAKMRELKQEHDRITSEIDARDNKLIPSTTDKERNVGTVTLGADTTSSAAVAKAAALRTSLTAEIQAFYGNLKGIQLANTTDQLDKMKMIYQNTRDQIMEQSEELRQNDQATSEEKIMIKQNEQEQLLELERGYHASVAEIQAKADADAAEARKKKIEDNKGAMDHMLENWNDMTSKMDQASAGWLNNASEGLTDFVMGGELDFRAFADSIIRDLIRIMIQKQMAGMFGAMFGLGFADGGVMSGGTPTPFAKGGVVNGPTTFPMSGGQTGLMGERGSEAIMPLSRGKDGKLGVKGGGGGGVNIGSINIKVDSNGQDGGHAQAKQISAELEKMLRGLINNEMDTQRRIGGSSNPVNITV